LFISIFYHLWKKEKIRQNVRPLKFCENTEKWPIIIMENFLFFPSYELFVKFSLITKAGWRKNVE